jgi:DmsE family decaheme c-type cytochrome
MKYQRRSFVAVLRSLVLVFGVAAPVHLTLAADAEKGSDAAPRKDVVLKGDAKCMRCHVGTDTVLAIGKTRHGVTADGRTPTCTSCHGDSETHMNKPEGVSERPKPERVFGKNSATPVDVRNQACLTCHQGGARIHWLGSTHASRELACTSCHQVHAARDKVRDKLTQTEVCFTCHKEQRAQISRPSRHPILEGKVTCSDCHNPHGSVGPSLLVRDSVNDTCFTCHMEKRGPFVRNHQPVNENCAICHNPHGTTNANLLKVRPPFLCQECHEPTSHRGTIPGNVDGTGTATNRAVVMARGCVNCHTNIHVTNSPADAPGERTFRR